MRRGPSEIYCGSLTGDLKRGRAAAPLGVWTGLKARDRAADSKFELRSGTDGNRSYGTRVRRRAPARRAFFSDVSCQAPAMAGFAGLSAR